jgi:hypothetical protein
MEKVKKQGLGDPVEMEEQQGRLMERINELNSTDDPDNCLHDFKFYDKVDSVLKAGRKAKTAQELSVAENQTNFLTAISKLIKKLHNSPKTLM